MDAFIDVIDNLRLPHTYMYTGAEKNMGLQILINVDESMQRKVRPTTSDDSSVRTDTRKRHGRSGIDKFFARSIMGTDGCVYCSIHVVVQVHCPSHYSPTPLM